jgi:predicted acetyltransferase
MRSGAPLTAGALTGVTERQEMVIEVGEARPEHRGVITALLDDYLQELAGHRERAVGATNARSYPYLDAYFSEPGRHAFLIRCDGEVVGFALIREPVSTGSPVSQVAEFYVTPGRRRLGVGHAATAAICRRFPGAWELQVHARNAAALRFWASCVRASAQALPVEREIQAEDGKRIQLTFHVG